MEGFNLKLYGMTFTNCFLHLSRYTNGNLQISMYGIDEKVNEVAHFADITLDQNTIKVREGEIVVDNYLKCDLIPQLKKLGILTEKISDCFIKFIKYPIYSLNTIAIQKYEYQLEMLSVA